MALWNDKRTPPGVFTDTRTGQNGSISGPKGWREQTGPEPTVESTFNRPQAPSWKTRTDREPTIWEKPPSAAPSKADRYQQSMGTTPKAPVAANPNTKAVLGAKPTRAAGANPKTTSYLQNIGGASKAVPGVSGVSKSPAKPGTYAPTRGKKVAIKPPRR